MDELRRIVGGTNSRYVEEVKGRWADFCAKVQFYGVWKKALKPPFPLDVRGGKLLFHMQMCCYLYHIQTIQFIFLFFSGVHTRPLQCTPIPFPLTNFTTKEAWK